MKHHVYNTFANSFTIPSFVEFGILLLNSLSTNMTH